MYNEIIKKHDYVDFFETTIKEFGGVSRNRNKYVLRKNVGASLDNQGAYFGCIAEGETPTGAYSDLSIVVFPSNEEKDCDDRWIIALGVGSLGYNNDYGLVSLPGTRRLFLHNLHDLRGSSYIKYDFIDIDTQDGFLSFCDQQIIPESLRNAVKNYGKVLLACTIIDPNDQDSCELIIRTYLGIYAQLRNWPHNVKQRKLVNEVVGRQIENNNEEQEIRQLLNNRKFIVLQGAPGTGKTRMAKKIVEGEKNVFFTQFHAETTYSDFIYGIVPDVEASSLQYEARKGIFVNAVEKAQERKDEKVYLIIDEINRANLANVLGPTFYLFEPTMSGQNRIEICKGLEVEKLPDNLYVIATMNTADRSLAVVDFALRRRFAWYTMVPHIIEPDDGYSFNVDYFNEIANIFDMYASDEELNLQPGQAYFITSESDDGSEIKERMKYEVMPLIKEYLIDGMLSRAKDDFVNFFRNAIDEEMFF